MFGLLALLGLGLGLAAVIGSDDSGDGASGDQASPTEDADVISDEAYRADFVAEFDDLVAEGEITQGQADQALGQIDFVSGAQDIDALGGDDYLLLGAGDDTVDGGAGDDVILTGLGDDSVDLGEGNDIYGADFRDIPSVDDIESFPIAENSGNLSEATIEGGDDTINGGVGNDAISDSFGSNEINGQQGADFIVSVDDASDQGTADTVSGGFGFDTLVVDEGDVVETGNGRDSVVVETYNGVEEGYDVVTITDFEQGKDSLVVQGQPGLLNPVGDEDTVTVENSQNGEDAIVLINNIPVVRVVGGAGLAESDVTVFVDSR